MQTSIMKNRLKFCMKFKDIKQNTWINFYFTHEPDLTQDREKKYEIIVVDLQEISPVAVSPATNLKRPLTADCCYMMVS